MADYVAWFNTLSMTDVDKVGGKNASLGEMIQHLSQAGVAVPDGFATTAKAYQDFLKFNKLEEKIHGLLDGLDIENISALKEVAAQIRGAILSAELMPELNQAVKQAYSKLIDEQGADISVAVRSSATAEDLPNASFAGQQETLLNVRGIDNVLVAIKQVYASLFTDRAIAYREHQGFDHKHVALSVGIQRMVRSDLASSGVMFSLDTESGYDQVVFVTSAFGLGELVVQGAINPDEFYLYKPNLLAGKPAVLSRHIGSKQMKMTYDASSMVQTEKLSEEQTSKFSVSDEDLLQLGQYALAIEKHYKRPMDIEWAKDGQDGKIYVVQARPETVNSQRKPTIERFELQQRSEVKISGRSIGQKIGQGVARLVTSLDDMDKLTAGEVLVTDMTDPDWEPVMKRASAIVTNRGGRTCHAAIIARELGIPAVVGCGEATDAIKDGDAVTVSCAEGDTGYIYEGILPFKHHQLSVDKLPELPVKIMLNVGNPDRAFAFQQVPNEGVGLARLEFLISNTIGIHPRALLEFDTLNSELQAQIKQKIAGYASPVEYYVEKLREGISTIAAAFANKPVIVRLSDFKSNEYANLIGGELYEPDEENPMLGFRGASRYASEHFNACFALECEAVKRVREQMGLTNVQIMIPFVRTLTEAKAVIDVLADNGLQRGKNDLKVVMMCELPSNALLAEQFLEHFDGFSIGSNDLTQLTLGLDRDSALVAEQFDERDAAVKVLLERAISACKKAGKYVGICGQGPSDHQDFAAWLLQQGIESMSLNPDSVLDTMLFLKK